MSSENNATDKETRFPSGCSVLDKLWKQAVEQCGVHKPGMNGEPERRINFITCGNLQKFMSMATMQCWLEKSQNGNSAAFPPITLLEEATTPANTKGTWTKR